MLLRRRWAFAACLGMATLQPLGCAQEREPVVRIQANALQKSFFVGALKDSADDPEFYYRTTVVDAQAGAGADGLFTSSDAEPTMRVRWEITEKLLLARLTYELINNTDGKGAKRTRDGQVVAAYAIEKHFDIKRSYNESTGEDLNIITENDTDRAWNEREYFRVDWSKNLVTDTYDFDTLSQLGIYYGVKFEPLAYYVNDPTSPDIPVFDAENGYFDVTNKVYAAPQVISDPDWGDFPACWLVGQFPSESCNPSELTLRHSFKKVVDHDYEPLNYDGARMDLFGWFTVDRFGYDRRYGLVDDKWHRFAARWNLWERSHAVPTQACATPETTPLGKSVHRDDDKNGTEDECEAVGRGSRCDEFRGECTIPLRDRVLKTIVWHVNSGFPEELFEGTAQALDGWSEAIRGAVVAARVAECRRTGESGCESQMGWPQPWYDNYSPPLGSNGPAEVPKVFVLCHNPVDPAKDDVSLCGPQGTSPRLGDLRYNFINLIQSPQITAPWGIMMDAEDPLTGEKIAGSVNEWGAVLDRAASTLVDILGLLNGTVDPSSYINGKNVSDWVKANQPGGAAERGAAMSAGELKSRKEAFNPKVLESYLAGLPSGAKGKPPAVRHRQRVDALTSAGRLGPGNSALSARLLQLRNTPIEAQLVSPEIAQLVGYNPAAPVSKDAIRRGSPFGRLNPVVRRGNDNTARVARARRHSCRIEDVEPDNLLGLARQAAKSFPAPDPKDAKAVLDYQKNLYLWARQEYSKGVLAHEMGHSMGLRHNFAATFDALNYHTPYWQLRTRNGAQQPDCPEGTTDGTECLGPRWRDPLSNEEIEGNIGRYATSSVMDYPGDQNHDQMLQGKYDRAAMRFGYGGVIDVWNQDGVSVQASGAQKEIAYKLTGFTTNPGLFGIYYFPKTPPLDPDADSNWYIHYSQYQKEFGLLGACQPDSSPKSVLGQTCTGSPLDIVDYRDLQDFAPDPDFAAFSWGNNPKAVDSKGRVRRGYLFSSDEYSDTGNVPSFTYDAGADAYEQIRFLEAGYENRYIVDAFRHNRVQFNSWDTTARMQSHYLDAIQLIAKTFAFGAVLDGDPTQPSAGFLDDGYYGPLGVGATVALDLYARTLTRPEPGYYYETDPPWGVDSQFFIADWAPQPEKYLYDYRVVLGDGRYVHNDFDYSQGYWWADYQTQVGAYYEKIWATYYLTEAFDFFISNSKEDFTDSRYKNVNFATVYPEQIRRLFSNLYTGDYEAFSPWTEPPDDPEDTPTQKLIYPNWHDAADLGARPSNAKLADPNFAFNERLYAMVWGAMFFPTNWSTAWINDARIAVLPAEKPDWPIAETYAFANPASGMTYRAHAVGEETQFGVTRQKGVGARILEWANKLAAIAYIVELDPLNNPVRNPDGSLVYVLDSSGRPQLNPDNLGADAALQKYVEEIDVFRQLTTTFNRPLSSSDLPQP